MSKAIIFGGYGSFGGHVARELAADGFAVTIAGRDSNRAAAFAKNLGAGCASVAADVSDPSSCCRALTGHSVAGNCTGPFSRLDGSLLDACLESGCHYADITDDRRYTALARGRGPDFAAKGLAAVYGCSSLPGISGALALLLKEQRPDPPQRVRVTLFIGNRNPKGLAAVQSCVEGLGRAIRAPQGTLLGFRNREVAPLPAPFGPRAVFNFDSPEYDLFPPLLGAFTVTVKVGFELRLATYTLALLAQLGSGYGHTTTQLLRLLSKPFASLGCSGGAVMTEFFFSDGATASGALVAPDGGQRMAALPCALVVKRLLGADAARAGAFTAYEFLGAQTLVEHMTAVGFHLHLRC